MQDNRNLSKTAGIIIIGDEILSGKVRDVNSFYLVTELRDLGVDVRQIAVVPDMADVIGNKVFKFSERYDYVFTTGGVGPTHDDVTMLGIARGFGVKLIRNHEIEKMLTSRFGESLNDAVLKMANLPEGAELSFDDDIRFPLVTYRNIFIFPGIPDYFRNKFSAIKERFRSPGYYLKRLFLNADEPDIAGILNNAVDRNTDVKFGSYPVSGNPGYRIIITAESKKEDALKKAFKDLITSIPENIVVKVE